MRVTPVTPLIILTELNTGWTPIKDMDSPNERVTPLKALVILTELNTIGLVWIYADESQIE